MNFKKSDKLPIKSLIQKQALDKSIPSEIADYIT